MIKIIPETYMAEQYAKYLACEEKAVATQKQYRREVLFFIRFLSGREITKDLVIEYKEELIRRFRPATVNTKLAAANGFMKYAGCGECCVKQLKIQRKTYCSHDRQLGKSEYMRLLKAAEKQEKTRLCMILQTLCGLGMRISELPFVTAESVKEKEVTVSLKGKNRTILMGKKLRKRLKQYIIKNGITSGPLFVTRSGRPVDRSNIWKMMKALCSDADVNPRKVFPHNLRHLFARTFYKNSRDIVKLADVLGHSSIDTTRIYMVSTGKKHQRYMDTIGLVL